MVCDPEFNIYYDCLKTKQYVDAKMGISCSICAKNKQTRKFPTLDALEQHMDKAHHLHYCNLCLNERPVLLFEQELYRHQ